MAASLEIPTVTEEDLRAFHHKHFNNCPAPRQLFVATNDDSAEYQYGEPDDDLGYYADGVKRTLTDDQIAIFRHSEVQSILRARQLAAEADHESDSGENVDQKAFDEREGDKGPGLIDTSATSLILDEPQTHDENQSNLAISPQESSSSAQEPHLTKAGKQNSKSKRKRGRPSTGRQISGRQSPKRKWQEYIDDSDANPDAMTHRRLAREMDEVKVESVDLDY